MLTLLFALQYLSGDDAAVLGPGPAALLLDGAAMSVDARDEGFADLLMMLALAHPPGPGRREIAAKAEAIYAVLGDVKKIPVDPPEPQLRRIWKRVRALFEVSPEQVPGFFETAKRRHLAPDWDADELGKSRWGWKDRFERLRVRR